MSKFKDTNFAPLEKKIEDSLEYLKTHVNYTSREKTYYYYAEKMLQEGEDYLTQLQDLLDEMKKNLTRTPYILKKIVAHKYETEDYLKETKKELAQIKEELLHYEGFGVYEDAELSGIHGLEFNS